MTNEQVWQLIVGVVGMYGVLTAVFMLYINAKFSALKESIEASEARIRDHVSTTMLEHIRLEHDGPRNSGPPL